MSHWLIRCTFQTQSCPSVAPSSRKRCPLRTSSGKLGTCTEKDGGSPIGGSQNDSLVALLVSAQCEPAAGAESGEQSQRTRLRDSRPADRALDKTYMRRYPGRIGA